jgi:hypothetical protein
MIHISLRLQLLQCCGFGTNRKCTSQATYPDVFLSGMLRLPQGCSSSAGMYRACSRTLDFTEVSYHWGMLLLLLQQAGPCLVQLLEPGCSGEVSGHMPLQDRMQHRQRHCRRMLPLGLAAACRAGGRAAAVGAGAVRGGVAVPAHVEL